MYDALISGDTELMEQAIKVATGHHIEQMLQLAKRMSTCENQKEFSDALLQIRNSTELMDDEKHQLVSIMLGYK